MAARQSVEWHRQYAAREIAARPIAPSVHQSRPHPLGPTIVAVNQKPLVASRLNEKDSFVFRRDSAGLGVPRGTFGKLNHISSGVVQHGSVERPAYVTSMATGRPLGNETGVAANHGVNGVTATHTMPTRGNASAGGAVV